MLNIGSKVFRNLPEQVAENVKQIAKIWEKLDGLDVYDNVIILEDLDPLTPEQLDILAKPVSFIVYNNDVYMKRGASGSTVLFDKVYQVSESSGTITFASGEIVVTYPLGTLTANVDSNDTYTTSKIDDLLDLKADKSDTYTKSEHLEKTYPVGAIYISTVNTSPASLFGGTWEALNSGNIIKIPLGDMHVYTGAIHDTGPDELKGKTSASGLSTQNYALSYYGSSSSGKVSILSAEGGTEPGQKFIPTNLWADMTNPSSASVYMWKRTA